MPLDSPASLSYNFDRDYDSLPPIVVPIKIKNTGLFAEDNTGLQLSAYSASFDKLLIYPEFGGDTLTSGMCASNIADSYRYFIDFGDGTISDSLTAEKFYENPGNYKITLVAVDSATNFYKSEHQPVLNIFNPVEDSLYLTYKEAPFTETSSLSHPIIITRYNSWQSWFDVSANGGYTINLAVSGNKKEFLNSEEYYTDPNVHLKTFSTFASATNEGFKIMTSIKTSNKFIYARRNPITPSVGLDYSDFPKPGSIFVGTSGTAEIYYYED